MPVVFWLWLAGCAPKQVAEPEVTAPPGVLTILHTNDMHGHYLPEPAEWLDGRPALGGMVALDGEVDRLRADRSGAVLLLDGGDILTGTPLTDLQVRGAAGGAMLELMEAIGYDAWALGNHEFDKGLANLQKLASAAEIPVLSSNVRLADGASMALPGQEPSRIFEVNGIRVGVIGATTEGLGHLMRPADFAQLKLLDVVEAVKAEAAALEADTDLLVVLSHIGLEADRELAERVPELDLIVGGHSHTRMPQAEQVNGIWIVQAGSYTRLLGVVSLKVEGDGIASFGYELRELQPIPEGQPAPEGSADVAALVGGYRAQIDGIYNEVISESPAVMGRSYNHESAVGRWITDVLRQTTGADLALYNGGGLRADLPAGPIRVLDIYQCFPFGNRITTFTLSGKEVRGIIEGNAAAEAFEKRGFLSISGARYTWRLVNGAPEVTAAWVGGKPLDVEARYTVASNSYITEQWEKHLGAEPRDLVTLEQSDFEAAVAWARSHPVKDPGDVRAERVK